MTVLSKRASNLLIRLAGDATLIEHRNSHFSGWRIEQAGESGTREVVNARAVELLNAGFIKRIFDPGSS